MKPPAASRPHVAGMTEAALAAWAVARGASAGAAKALARTELARFAGREPKAMAGAALLQVAGEHLDRSLPPAEAIADPDGTVRFAVRLSDGAVVETVLIRQPARLTVCLSSQVGCARGCVFCETGRLGLQRNLRADEIVSQFAIAARYAAEHALSQPRNAVFMGMGEPLDNLDEVLAAIDVLRERAGFAVPERRITVSTVGIVPRMDELAARSNANLAVSLHALERKKRLELLPVARRFSLDDLRAAIERAPRTVLLQWTLIEGVNDCDEDAVELARFCRDLDVRVNLIPLNPGPRPEQRAPRIERCRAFQKLLLDRGVRAMLRLPHGQGVGGACGQLAGARRCAR